MKNIILLFIMLCICIFSGCTENVNTRCLTVNKTIIIVGGCDQRGNCGVGYNDGTYGREYMPVSGQIISEYICK